MKSGIDMVVRFFDYLMTKKSIRRLFWRIGRRLYSLARREEQTNDIERNGESYIQSCVIRSIPLSVPLTVIDIGANRGDWVAALWKQLPLVRRQADLLHIYAFEPVPSTADALGVRITGFNPSGLITVNRIAISNSSGIARMGVFSDTGGTNSFHFDQASADLALDFVDVTRMPIAIFCKEQSISHIHLIKCDTEGHDLNVLEGALPLFQTESIDVFQFEYNHRWVLARGFLKDVFNLVEGLPYRIARIEPDHIEVFDRWHPELDRFFQSNYLIVREPALGWFKTSYGHFNESNTYA
jgi:FkbM family methyltransferase